MNKLPSNLQDFFYGLASENRQKIFFQVFLDGQEHTVGNVAQQTGLGQSTVSEHLAILKRAGILLSRKEGKEVYYRPDRDHLLAVLSHLTSFLTQCCQE
ncbi:MAG TPA: metalloregulator ArsR/SmtB family transcription factor [Ktedonobacteraceae bacterium]